MKKGTKLRKLSRSRIHRRNLLRNLTTSLIEHERIETTVAKAKELRRVADHIVTLAKRDTTIAHRKVWRNITTKEAGQKMFDDLAVRFRGRSGGYTRVLKTRFRRGDCAPMAVVEWSETPRTILTQEQLQWKEARKNKERRAGLTYVLGEEPRRNLVVTRTKPPQTAQQGDQNDQSPPIN